MLDAGARVQLLVDPPAVFGGAEMPGAGVPSTAALSRFRWQFYISERLYGPVGLGLWL